jgi:putative RNA 2'-phosphotransferase
MNDARLVKVSKYLSKHLRHQPERLGLTLQPGGWIAVGDLLAATARHGFPISIAELEEVVSRNDEQRFAFDPSGALIRANQGHSVPLDLQLEPVEPPPVLYHGTAAHSVEAITRDGLQRMARHHVHLSSTIPTARAVGSRHGRPVVFEINATAMHQGGWVFYQSANGVWLVDRVPPEFLRLLTE